jgi:hypothetical protein
MDSNWGKYVEIEARYQIQRAMEKFGAEGTEQKINELYTLMPEIKKLLLDTYKKILQGN